MNDPVRSDDYQKTAREKRLQRALTLDPRSPDLYLALGHNLHIASRDTEALAALQKAVRLGNADTKRKADLTLRNVLPAIKRAAAAAQAVQKQQLAQQTKAG